MIYSEAERSTCMENLDIWQAGLLVVVGVAAAIVLPISLLFLQAARDQRASDRKSKNRR